MGGVLSLVPLASNTAELAGLFFLASASAQAIAIGGNATLARRGADATSLLNAANACFGFGSLAAAPIHESLSGLMPGVCSYWAVSALCISSAVPFLRSGAAAFARRTPGLRPEPTPPPNGDTKARDETRLFVGAVLALVAACVGAEATVATWTYSDALLRLGCAPSTAAITTAAFWGGLVGGRLIASALASGGRLSPSQILRLSLPRALVGATGALAAPMIAVGPAGQAVYAGSLAALGLGLAPSFPSAVALLAERVPPTGRTQAAVQLASCGGAGFAAPLAGWLAAGATGTSACFSVSAGAVALGLASLAVVHTAKIGGGRGS